MTTEQTVLRGSALPTVEHGRRPRTNDQRRVCGAEDCNTVLSRYNLADHCRVHLPPSFPRIRGVPQ
jgi:hypothetical protein